VLGVERDAVGEREAVVRGDKVDRVARPAAAAPARAAVRGPPAGGGRRERSRPGALGALDERARGVAEGAVPLRPAAAVVRERADLPAFLG